MQLGHYKNLNKAKLVSYYEEGFTKEQIQKPLSDMLVSLNSIINRYKKKYGSDHEKWSKAAKFMQLSFTKPSKVKKDAENDYLYEQVRIYLRKDESEIEGLKYKIELPTEEKRDRYINILSEIASNCISACVEEFKQEAKGKAEIKPSLQSRTPSKSISAAPSKKGKGSNSQTSKKLQSVNEEWDKTYNSGKKRERSTNIGIDNHGDNTKRRKHIRFFDDNKKTAPKNNSEEAGCPDGNSSPTPKI